MTTQSHPSCPTLRLRRDDDGLGGPEESRTGPITIKPNAFPRNTEARRLLIAGTVRVPAYPEAEVTASQGHENGSESATLIAGRIGTGTLIRDIESTLDRMQSRLDDFKRQVDDVIPFPVASPEEDRGPFRPRAA